MPIGTRLEYHERSRNDQCCYFGISGRMTKQCSPWKLACICVESRGSLPNRLSRTLHLHRCFADGRVPKRVLRIRALTCYVRLHLRTIMPSSIARCFVQSRRTIINLSKKSLLDHEQSASFGILAFVSSFFVDTIMNRNENSVYFVYFLVIFEWSSKLLALHVPCSISFLILPSKSTMFLFHLKHQNNII